ncbi:hypothetical protein [Variovorax sp. GT1P44]|uniref:hypothetical protein n=1 Tax=Variovorax sp. GT1P44 TaxID=3443742 RepID=UPI003F47460F
MEIVAALCSHFSIASFHNVIFFPSTSRHLAQITLNHILKNAFRAIFFPLLATAIPAYAANFLCFKSNDIQLQININDDFQ